MEDIRDARGFKGFVERLTLGITRVLEGLPGVTDVRFVEREPVERRCLMSWEHRNDCELPEDLRDFYLTTDGFTLTWCTKLESEAVPLGSMVINSLAKLLPLSQSAVFSLPNMPALSDLDSQEEPEESDDPPGVPHFGERSRIFELDPCGGNGKVCLVYRNCSQDWEAQDSEVWFLDRALYWHYISSSFTAYYRLLITHLGLPEWQYNFTPYGPSPQAKQWACLYRPLTAHGDAHVDSNGDPIVNRLDLSRAFRGKVKPPAPKKKSPAQPGGGGGTPKAHGGSARLSGTRR
ncbi:tubulin polyglutamylase complex subunit 2 isoform X2 [Anguilla rostrata]|uniref:tubulin polyglutamylase complex subunit 2 isoform X2 n=1 Tax=Anguilla rostrata TaxID=7938 RepID=UPI0030CEE696